MTNRSLISRLAAGLVHWARGKRPTQGTTKAIACLGELTDLEQRVRFWRRQQQAAETQPHKVLDDAAKHFQ